MKRMMSVWLAALALTVGLALLPSSLRAVTVSPTALYIDHETRSTTLTIRNPGSRAVEISLDFVFGYPQNNATGGVHVPLFEVVEDGEPSAAGWLRAFPRQMRLEPGERQVVRVLVSPPGDLPDGEYWARVLLTIRGGQAPIEEIAEGRSFRINVETVMVLPATYRKGSLRTGLEVLEATARVDSEGVEAEFELSRQGDAAYLGRMQATLLDPSGREVASVQEHLAVYRTLRRRVSIPLPEGVSVGEGYRLRYRFDTERSDLPRAGPLPSPPVTGTLAVEAG